MSEYYFKKNFKKNIIIKFELLIVKSNSLFESNIMFNFGTKQIIQIPKQK